MAKDLSPKFKKLKTAEQELVVPYVAGERPFGEVIGGLQAFSRVFKRGYGDEVFGSDENGIWLGAADYEDGKFKVNMAGEATLQSATFKDENDTTFIDAKGLVSTVNFDVDTVESLGNSRTTTSSDFVDLSSTTLDFTLIRQSRVLFLASASAGASDWANEGIIRVTIGLDVDGTIYPNATYGFNVVLYWHDTSDTGYTRVRPHWFGQTIVTLSAGEHTAKLRFHRHSLDNLTAEVVDTSLTRIILGK